MLLENVIFVIDILQLNQAKINDYVWIVGKNTKGTHPSSLELTFSIDTMAYACLIKRGKNKTGLGVDYLTKPVIIKP